MKYIKLGYSFDYYFALFKDNNNINLMKHNITLYDLNSRILLSIAYHTSIRLIKT